MLVGRVAAVDQMGELRIDLEPAVGVAVRFVPHAVRLMVRQWSGRINNRAGDGDAVVQDRQSGGMIDVLPEAVATADPPPPSHPRQDRR